MDKAEGVSERSAPWRGALVFVTWVCWPLIFYTVETVVRVSLSSSDGCGVTGCSELEGWPFVLSMIVMLIVPVAVTRWWWHWRRRTHAESQS